MNLGRYSVFINSGVKKKEEAAEGRMGLQERSFHVCFSQKAVKSYLSCSSFVCLKHCTDRFYFFSDISFCLGRY